ncbi:MAG: tetratricopeptide repeat protein [Bacteroidales bacterium]|nr:MAG: tetratricopeptide repeat protein [Bacteroidales bacterium]
MAKKKKGITDDRIQGVESALSKTEQFIEDNQKMLTIITMVIVVIVAGYLGYKRFIVYPAEEEAQSQMFVAEQYFERDSFNLALYGDGNYFGFLDIIEEYRITKAANLAHYYTGISYLRLEEYEIAIEYLEKFDSDDMMLAPLTLGAIGDSYLELDDPEQAVEYYTRASRMKNNDFINPIYLLKAGKVYENLGEYEKALENYERIRNEYPESQEGRTIEKYITRVKLFLE